MKDCTNPDGHRWIARSIEIAAGSTLVECEHCGATGYRLRPSADEKVAQALGQTTRERS